MRDSIDLQVPGRKWAASAIEDFRREGFEAELLGCGGDDAPWTVRVTGPREAIDEIRQAEESRAQVPSPVQRVCWETFVNTTLGGRP